MQINKYLSTSLIKNMMIILNFINIVFQASIILFSTKYICNKMIAREFLDTLIHLPRKPEFVFFAAIIGYISLVLLIHLRRRVNFKYKYSSTVYNGWEMILCFFVVYVLYMGYNGLILLVFADVIFHIKNKSNTLIVLGGIAIVFLFSSYDVISTVIPMISIDNYIQVFDAFTKTSLLVIINILESTNLILFIMFLITYIADQIEENENITKELSMINEVNKQLRDYAAITEKIGENNERKRLAREIHDTLGHALTGIAAGVDACIAMIDIDSAMTKKQLGVVSKVVREGIGDVRRSLNKLRPGALEEHTLKEAILKTINEFSEVSDVKINFNYQLDKIDFENTKEDIIFRIVQESITNSIRHGLAKEINIDISQKETNLEIIIKDNGIGCVDIKMGYGLKQMKERVAILNGQLQFSGEDGFLIKVTIPMKEGEKYD